MTQHLITLSDPGAPAAEAYRTLRTNLEFSTVDAPLQTLLVTTASPEQTKSLVVANLAIIMAEGEQEVILVDADLRRPDQHQVFGLPNEQGFTDMFRDEAMLADPPLQPIGGTTLRLLTSGRLPPVPAQVLMSNKMGAVLESLSKRAGMVIFDAPPVIAASDASLLANRLDGVLLVVRANHTRREHVLEAKARLERANARLLGAVLTDASVDADLERYYATHY